MLLAQIANLQPKKYVFCFLLQRQPPIIDTNYRKCSNRSPSPIDAGSLTDAGSIGLKVNLYVRGYELHQIILQTLDNKFGQCIYSKSTHKYALFTLLNTPRYKDAKNIISQSESPTYIQSIISAISPIDYTHCYYCAHDKHR